MSAGQAVLHCPPVRLATVILAAENLALAAALAALALLPIAEILLRALFQVGISGAASLAQHFALIAGMLGAVVAAREGRLLSLSTLDLLLHGPAALLARFFARAVAVIVATLLCLASAQFVLAERAAANVMAKPPWERISFSSTLTPGSSPNSFCTRSARGSTCEALW